MPLPLSCQQTPNPSIERTAKRPRYTITPLMLSRGKPVAAAHGER